MKKSSLLTIIFLILLLLIWIEPANAAGVFDDVQNKFKEAVSSTATGIIDAATRLFWTLAIISLVWTGISLIFRKGDLSDFFAEFIRFILFIGFFWWLLKMGPTFASAILDSFHQLGGTAANSSVSLTPSGIVDHAFSLWEVAEPMVLNLPLKIIIPAYLLLIVVTILIGLIAVNVMMLNITTWVFAYAGIFILGFGGSRWTSDMAIAYFKQLLNLGLQILTMLILVSVGTKILTDMIHQVSTFIMFDFVVILLCVLILFVLTNKLPAMVGSLAGGFGNGGMGTFGGGAVMGGMAMAGGALFGAAAALKTAGTEMIGAAKAIKAAKEGGNSNSGGGQQSSAIAAISSGSGKDNGSRSDGQPLTTESGAKRSGDTSSKGGSGGGQQSAAAGSASAPAAAAAAENSISGGDSSGGADNAGNAGGSADSGGSGGGSGSSSVAESVASTGEAGNSTTSSPMFNNNGDFRDPTSMLTSNTGGGSPLAQAMGGGSPPPPPPAAAPKISTWQATKQVAKGMVANKFNDAIAKTAGGRVMQRWEQQATNAANSARMQQQQSVAERTANALEGIAQTLNKGDS